MQSLSVCLVFFGWIQVIYGQALLVDRPLPNGAGTVARLGVANGFLGDHFELGVRGEVWVIDSLAVWGAPTPAAGVHRLGDLFESVKLLGGIEAQLPPPGQPAQPDCACHNLAVLKNAGLQPGSDPERSGTRVSMAGPGIWRIEFNDLKWSVPGGTSIQFGVLVKARVMAGGRRVTWFDAAAVTDVPHDLRLFDDDGKLLGRYTPDGPPVDPAMGMHVQVRGHKTAAVSVHSSGGMLEVTVQKAQGFDPAEADPETLRFGLRKAAPVKISSGGDTLVLQFRRQDIEIHPGELTACLTGKQRNGIPFEGCDLLPKQ